MLDLVRVNDAGRILLNKKEAYFWDSPSVVEVKGWVSALLRERGKIVPGSRRDGHNIWTNTGREFLAMLMSYQADAVSAYRNDRIGYIGVGAGVQSEDVNVLKLQVPLAYYGTSFLAEIDHAATSFPLSPTRTTVRFSRVFREDEITFNVAKISISELGLYTNGNQNSFVPGGRAVGIDDAPYQSPVAYKLLEDPVEKTNALEFQVDWEIRF